MVLFHVWQIESKAADLDAQLNSKWRILPNIFWKHWTKDASRRFGLTITKSHLRFSTTLSVNQSPCAVNHWISSYKLVLMGSNVSSENFKMADSTSQLSANQQWPVNIIPKESQQQQVKINFADEAGVDEIVDISAQEVRGVKFISIFSCKVYLFIQDKRLYKCRCEKSILSFKIL